MPHPLSPRQQMLTQPSSSNQFDIGKMLALVSNLYGMQQDQALASDRAALAAAQAQGAQADAQGKLFASSHAQELYDRDAQHAEMQQRMLDAQLAHYGAENSLLEREKTGVPTELDRMRYMMTTGQPYVSEAERARLAEEKHKANLAAQAADLGGASAAVTQHDQPQILQPGEQPDTSGDPAFLRRAADFLGTPMAAYSALHNTGAKVYDWIAKGFGSPSRAYYFNPNSHSNYFRERFGVQPYNPAEPQVWQQK